MTTVERTAMIAEIRELARQLDTDADQLLTAPHDTRLVIVRNRLASLLRIVRGEG